MDHAIAVAVDKRFLQAKRYEQMQIGKGLAQIETKVEEYRRAMASMQSSHAAVDAEQVNTCLSLCRMSREGVESEASERAEART